MPLTGDSPENRRETANSGDHEQPLLPGLPDHVSQLALSLLPPSLLFSVSRSWRRVLYAPSFPPFFSLFALSLSSKTFQNLSLSCFDPISSSWLSLPVFSNSLGLIFRHPSYISRCLPVQSVSVSGKLVLVAATADNLVPAFPNPVIFDPGTITWKLGPEMRFPRRWCATGAVGGAVYVASGVGSRYTTRTARSVEKLDFSYFDKNRKRTSSSNSDSLFRNTESSGWEWEEMGELTSEKLSTEATTAVGWQGKLLVANVTAKEGVMYDCGSDTWHEMKKGMIRGWRGPAAAMDEDTLYVIDRSKGILRRYDADGDCWEDVIWVPELRGAEQIAAGGGRVSAIRAGGCGIVVVDVVTSPSRFWIVDTPDGEQAVAVHILPRISRPEL